MSPRLEVVKTVEPEARQAGEIVPDVDILVAKRELRQQPHGMTGMSASSIRSIHSCVVRDGANCAIMS